MRRPDYAARAKVLKALAHPTRLLMVDALTRRELCVCELQKLAGSDMSTVSKHLSLLKAAGVVRDRRQGSWVYYSLRCACVSGFFKCVEGVLRGRGKR
ncbi:MAG: metalloregulator ArsR/SmtB family transcription factor [Elusimicrobiota bacterium]|jgi:ArsR family transcriptional regulator